MYFITVVSLGNFQDSSTMKGTFFSAAGKFKNRIKDELMSYILSRLMNILKVDNSKRLHPSHALFIILNWRCLGLSYVKGPTKHETISRAQSNFTWKNKKGSGKWVFLSHLQCSHKLEELELFSKSHIISYFQKRFT